jgi:small conductance mechanosensitive channel
VELFQTLLNHESLAIKALLLIAFAAGVHVLVILTRVVAARLLSAKQLRHRKTRSVITLLTSVIVFVAYFFAIGLILREMGISLTAYLASASVIGLAVGFGSQGIVQDVVMGLTFVFSDLLDVGDLVEISGQTGIVKGITMRFVELENALGAQVFIPNRTINNVVNYPRGYIRCLVDVTLRGDDVSKQKMVSVAEELMDSTYQQFPGILLTAPSIEGRQQTSTNKDFLRIKFRIWPNRGQPIETTFVKELLAALTSIDENYKDWMIAVTYEVEKVPSGLKLTRHE